MSEHISVLILDTYGVLFRRSPRYLEDVAVEAVDEASHDVADEALFLRDAMRRSGLSEDGVEDVLDGIAAKYCKNLDVWKELTAWRSRYRLIVLHRGPAGVLDRWDTAYGLSGVADRLVPASSLGFTGDQPDLYVRLQDEAGALPGSCLLVDDERAPVEAARAAGLVAYRFGTVHGLRVELTAATHAGET